MGLRAKLVSSHVNNASISLFILLHRRWKKSSLGQSSSNGEMTLEKKPEIDAAPLLDQLHHPYAMRPADQSLCSVDLEIAREGQEERTGRQCQNLVRHIPGRIELSSHSAVHSC